MMIKLGEQEAATDLVAVAKHECQRVEINPTESQRSSTQSEISVSRMVLSNSKYPFQGEEVAASTLPLTTEKEVQCLVDLLDVFKQPVLHLVMLL